MRSGVTGPRSQRQGWTIPIGLDLVARVVPTDVRDGDLAVDGEQPGLDQRRRAVADRPWMWLRQVHGSRVVVLDDGDPGELAGADADAVITARHDVVLAAHSADCATIALVGAPPQTFGGRPVHGTAGPRISMPAGTLERVSRLRGWPMVGEVQGVVIGVVHAGWRGLEAGVLDAAVAEMRAAGAAEVVAVLGPCIGVECYEFGESDLARLVERIGPAAAGRTRDGRPALDLRLGVRAALAALDVEVVAADQRCTACSTVACGTLQGNRPDGQRGPRSVGGDRTSVPVLHSHRARGDVGRQALVAWLERLPVETSGG